MTEYFVDPDIAKAKTINADFYTSTEVFEQCREKIFARSWQFVGSEDLVKENGDVHPFTLLESCLDEPLLLTRDKTGGFMNRAGIQLPGSRARIIFTGCLGSL